MGEWINEIAKNYGVFAFTGIVAASIRRIRNKMTNLRFVAFMITSVFVSVITALFLREWFNIGIHGTLVICAISSHFSDELLDEVQEIITGLSEIIKEWISKKIS